MLVYNSTLFVSAFKVEKAGSVREYSHRTLLLIDLSQIDSFIQDPKIEELMIPSMKNFDNYNPQEVPNREKYSLTQGVIESNQLIFMVIEKIKTNFVVVRVNQEFSFNFKNLHRIQPDSNSVALNSFVYTLYTKQFYVQFDEKESVHSCKTDSWSTSNMLGSKNSLSRYIAIFKYDMNVRYFQFRDSFPMLFSQIGVATESSVNLPVGSYPFKVLYLDIWKFPSGNIGVTDAMSIVTPTPDDYIVQFDDHITDLFIITKTEVEDADPVEKLDYYMFEYPQTLPPIEFYSNPYNISIYPAPEIEVWGLPWSYMPDLLDMKFTVEPIPGLTSPTDLKITARYNRYSTETWKEIPKNSSDSKWDSSMNSIEECLKMSYSPSFIMNALVADSLHFYIVMQIGKRKYYSYVDVHLTKCVDTAWMYWEYNGIWTKWAPAYHFDTNNICRVYTPTNVLVVGGIITTSITLIWILSIFKQISAAYFWTILQHYQHFGFILLFDIFSDDINMNSVEIFRSSLGNFILMHMIPYSQAIFPPSSFLTLYYSNQDTWSITNQGEAIIFSNVWILFLLLLIIFMNLISKKQMFYEVFQHNFIILAMLFLIYFDIISLIPLALLTIGCVLFIICRLRFFSEILIYADEKHTNVHFSEFRYLRLKVLALMYNWLLVVKVIVILATYFLPNLRITFLGIMLIEIWWMLYLYKIKPYQSWYLNNIELINQAIFILTLAITIIEFPISSIRMELIMSIVLFPYSYIIALVHYLATKYLIPKKEKDHEHVLRLTSKTQRSGELGILLSDYSID